MTFDQTQGQLSNHIQHRYIYKSKKLETSYMATNRMNKEIVVYSQNGILLSCYLKNDIMKFADK